MIPKDEIERQEWLEAYLNKQLRQEEVEWLEKNLKTDDILKQEVLQLKKAMKTIIDAQAEQQMRNTLQQLRQKQPRPILQPLWRYTLIGGLAASLTIILYFSFSPVQIPTPDYDIQVMRNTDPVEMETSQKAAYEAFFDGQAKMAEGEFLEATYQFEKILQVSELRPYFKEAAQWHLVVSSFKSQQHSKAALYLEQLDNCEACEYEVSWAERWKIKWRLYWLRLFQ